MTIPTRVRSAFRFRPGALVVMLLAAVGTLLGGPRSASLNASPAAPFVGETLIIQEFRLRGSNLANDEFIDLYNPGTSALTVTVSDGSSGWALARSTDGVTPTVVAVVPTGTVVPAKGHFLMVNSVGYNLLLYPSGEDTTAIADVAYSTDIPDNSALALFSTSNTANFSVATRLDSVGFTSQPAGLFKEGTGLATLTPFSIDYAFVRRNAGGCVGSYPPSDCTSVALMQSTAGPVSVEPQDTGNNAADFIFVDTNGTSAGAGQRLGAPAPQNLASPVVSDGSTLTPTMLDPCVASTPPNVVRDFTSNPAQNSTFGTLDIRRTFTNTTGANITRLRFRVVDLSTFPAISGVADLRPRTSTAVVVTVDRAPCGTGTSNVTVQGTTLEQPPSQPNGGGYNSSLWAGTISGAAPLAHNSSIDVRFLIGIQQTGAARFCVVPETVPASASAPMCFIGDTQDPSGLHTPTVTGATTNEDAQTTSGLVISRNALDGAEVTHFKIAAITGGVLYKNDGTTAISNGSFVTFAEGQAGLKFTPSVNLYSPSTTFSFTAQSATSASDAGAGGTAATATITVNAVPDLPSFAGTTTIAEDATSGGFVLSRHAVDGAEITHFKITGISGGTVLKSDGVTTVAEGAFVTYAEGQAGLKFQPTANANNSSGGPFRFSFQAATGNSGSSALSSAVQITLSVTPVNDAPVASAVAFPAFNADSGSRAVTLTATDVDSASLTFAIVTNPTIGTLGSIGSPSCGGTPTTCTATVSYTPGVHQSGSDSFTYKANDGTVDSNTATVSLTINPVNFLPEITTSPVSQTVVANTTAVFTVAAIGLPTPTYQWQVSTNGGASFTNLANVAPHSGTTTATLTITGVPSSLDQLRYRAVATNSVGSTTSAAAILTVLSRGLVLSSTDVDFGYVQLGGTSTRVLTLSNTGNTTLSITGLTLPAGFTANYSAGTIASGGAQPVTLTFTPTSIGTFTGTLTVASDQTSASTTSATLTGRGSQCAGDVPGEGWLCVGTNWVPPDHPLAVPPTNASSGQHPVGAVAVFRPGNNTWYTKNGVVMTQVGWGLAGDVPLRGDWDGDGVPDPAVYRPSEGNWYILSSASNFVTWTVYQWGLPGDTPLPADIDGDLKTDLIVYRPSTGEWFGRFSSDGYSYAGAASAQWGLPGDLPQAADFDGDGKADLVVFRPNDGHWYVRFSSTGYSIIGFGNYGFGLTGDTPVPADYDGDGKTDLAVFRPSNQTFYISTSSSGFNTMLTLPWGLPGDIPVVGDFDADGKADVVVWRPTNGTWYLLFADANFTTAISIQWGLPGDVPLRRK